MRVILLCGFFTFRKTHPHTGPPVSRTITISRRIEWRSFAKHERRRCKRKKFRNRIHTKCTRTGLSAKSYRNKCFSFFRLAWTRVSKERERNEKCSILSQPHKSNRERVSIPRKMQILKKSGFQVESTGPNALGCFDEISNRNQISQKSRVRGFLWTGVAVCGSVVRGKFETFGCFGTATWSRFVRIVFELFDHSACIGFKAVGWSCCRWEDGWWICFEHSFRWSFPCWFCCCCDSCLLIFRGLSDEFDSVKSAAFEAIWGYGAEKGYVAILKQVSLKFWDFSAEKKNSRNRTKLFFKHHSPLRVLSGLLETACQPKRRSRFPYHSMRFLQIFKIQMPIDSRQSVFPFRAV